MPIINRCFTVILLVLGAATTALADKPQVVSSIKPVQLIVNAVGGEQVNNHLLLPAAVSPHLYQLKPSDRRRLAQADKVFWMGAELEGFLRKPLSLLQPGRAVALLTVSTSDSDLVHEKKRDSQLHDHQHHGADPHLWLDPLQALVLAEQVAKTLSQLTPSAADYYQANLQRFQGEVLVLHQQLMDQFAATTLLQGYIVLHDGYTHFEERYGLSHVEAVSISPEHKPGARQLLKIQHHIENGSARCVFLEPQYQHSSLRQLLVGEHLREGLLDPLGGDANSYVEFMVAFGRSFYSCIRP